jgi:hypothetical protein
VIFFRDVVSPSGQPWKRRTSAESTRTWDRVFIVCQHLKLRRVVKELVKGFAMNSMNSPGDARLFRAMSE